MSCSVLLARIARIISLYVGPLRENKAKDILAYVPVVNLGPVSANPLTRAKTTLLVLFCFSFKQFFRDGRSQSVSLKTLKLSD